MLVNLFAHSGHFFERDDMRGYLRLIHAADGDSERRWLAWWWWSTQVGGPSAYSPAPRDSSGGGWIFVTGPRPVSAVDARVDGVWSSWTSLTGSKGSNRSSTSPVRRCRTVRQFPDVHCGPEIGGGTNGCGATKRRTNVWDNRARFGISTLSASRGVCDGIQDGARPRWRANDLQFV